MKRSSLFLLLAALAAARLAAQTDARDSVVFEVSKNEFMDKIKADSEKFRTHAKEPKKSMRVDFRRISAPADVKDFTAVWHTPPVSQGNSGMCWCFSTTSFFESEVHRLTGREVKLSELYTVYWEYVEKARRYIRERGDSEFGEGSEANAVPRIWKTYGIVPESAYSGLPKEAPFHDHVAMFHEMEEYLHSVKTSNLWNEDAALATIRSILDHYIGAPPGVVSVNGKSMTPPEYLANVLKLRLDDYVDVLSLKGKPYYQKVEYEVGDNWWHNADYLNVPLDDFVALVKKAIRAGYSVALGGDTSEPGYDGHAGIGVVPTFDIPTTFINDDARAFRFYNGTTGDDHGIHLVGYTQKDGSDWYLIKDSGSGSRNNTHPGYYFYREDYVKLKMMDVLVHKDMVRELLARSGE